MGRRDSSARARQGLHGDGLLVAEWGGGDADGDAALDEEEEDDALDARDEVPGQPHLRLISESAAYSQSAGGG